MCCESNATKPTENKTNNRNGQNIFTATMKYRYRSDGQNFKEQNKQISEKKLHQKRKTNCDKKTSIDAGITQAINYR